MSIVAPRAAAMAGLAVAAALGFAALHLTTGSPALAPEAVLRAFGAGPDDPMRLIVVDIRSARVLLALLAGTALGVVGALLQDALRNPLAAPELLGVSGGASLVVAVITVLHAPIPRAAVPVAATLGGIAIGTAVVLTAARARDAATLLLVGIAASTFLSGAVIAVITLGKPSDVGLFYQFLLGSLANRTWDSVWTVLPWTLVCLPLALLLTPTLNVMRLGDAVAAGLGVRVGLIRALVLVISGLLTASIVAVAGPIGFVALIAPHLVRMALGTVDARWVVPLSGVLGAVLLLGADTVGRAVVQPREVAVGVWTVLVGAPFLLILMRLRNRGAA
ncbi:MAG: iron ABC transporter permease [Arachnia sp.]